VVQCCAVDAQPIGLPVRLTVGEHPTPGSWVAITGTWDVAEARGERRAVIVPTTVARTERPDQPYLY
jgi:putative membrane protein